MNTLKKLWNAIWYYWLPGFLIFAATMFAVRKTLFRLIIEQLDLTKHSIFYMPLWYVLNLGLVAIIGYFFFVSTRNKRYKVLTGRNFEADRSKYNREYFSLVDYFRYDHAEPHRMMTDNYEVQNWRECKGLCFGYDKKGRAIWLPQDCECNIVVFGPPGSSKTAGFCNVNAITFPGSCLIVDIKNDIYNYVKSTGVKRKILRFCPDDPDAINVSAHFDPLMGFRKMTPTNRKLAIQTMAESLIPDDGGNDGNYFPETGRMYFRGITHLMYHMNNRVTFPEIVHAALQEPNGAVNWVKKALESDCVEAKELLGPFYGNNEKNVSGGYQSMTKRLNIYSDPILDEILTYKKGKTISTAALDKGYDIYLQITEEHLTALGGLLTMVIESFSKEFLRRPDTSTGVKSQYVLMMLDELSSLHLTYDLLNLNLSKLRSKSILSAIILQNLPQLQRLYTPVGAESILGNCHIQAILGANDSTTSQYFSKKLGDKRDLKTSNSVSGSGMDKKSSQTTNEVEVPVYKPADVADIGSHAENILCVHGKYTFLKKLNCYKD